MPAAAKKTILASRSTEEIFFVAAGVAVAVLETHRGPHEAQGKKPHQGIFSKNRRLRLGPTWVKWSGTHQDRKCSRSKTVSGSALDANGNTLNDPSGKSYSWDFDNRLTQVVNPGVGTTAFHYDPFGRRIQKAGPLGTTNFLYDGMDRNANVIEEVDNAGNVLARFTQSLDIDQPLAEYRSGTTSYYEQDGINSVTSLSNSAAALASTYTYDAFGKLTASTGTLTNPFQFTGRNYDTETGISYYRARYYDENLGRFITEDPIGFIGGHNFYRYVYNNPAGLNDPWGLSAAGVGQVQAQCLLCTKNLTDQGQRFNGSGTGWGWWNNFTSWFTKHKGCWEQALSVENCLNAYPLPGGWNFNDVPVEGGSHHVVRGHDNDPNDPDVICDPWRNESYPIPKPPSGGGR